MQKKVSRRSLLKVAGSGGAGLALVGMTPQPAAAAISDVQAVVDFTNTTLDRLTIRAQLDGITKTTDPADLLITVAVKNVKTLEEESWVGNPTSLR